MSTGPGNVGYVYKVNGNFCYVVWPNSVATNYRLHDSSLVVVGRAPPLVVGDLVVRGGLSGLLTLSIFARSFHTVE